MGISHSVRPVNQQQKAAGSEVLLEVVLCNVRSRCISQEIQAGFEQIHRESANVKVCQYQVMMSNGLFEETNEKRIFSKVFYN